MRNVVLRLAALGLVAASGLAHAQASADFSRFLSWFGGEWNNHEQVWQQRLDSAKLPGGKAEDPITHTHHVFAPVKVPALGDHVYYVQQSLDGDLTKSYRQRLYRMSSDAGVVKLEIFAFPDDKAVFNAHLRPEVLTHIDPQTLRTTPGCEVFWRYNEAANAYDGTMPKDACAINSPRLGKKIIINDTLKLTESEIWINDQARDEQGGHVFGSKTNTPVKNRKVRYHAGWAFGTEPGTGKKLKGERALMIHNEGQRLALKYEDDTPSPYSIELAQLTYQNTSTAILKLALVDSSEAKRGAYTWANTDSKRIGLNLGWIQFGFTEKAAHKHFSFTMPMKGAAKPVASRVIKSRAFSVPRLQPNSPMSALSKALRPDKIMPLLTTSIRQAKNIITQGRIDFMANSPKR